MSFVEYRDKLSHQCGAIDNISLFNRWIRIPCPYRSWTRHKSSRSVKNLTTTYSSYQEPIIHHIQSTESISLVNFSGTLPQVDLCLGLSTLPRVPSGSLQVIAACNQSYTTYPGVDLLSVKIVTKLSSSPHSPSMALISISDRSYLPKREVALLNAFYMQPVDVMLKDPDYFFLSVALTCMPITITYLFSSPSIRRCTTKPSKIP